MPQIYIYHRCIHIPEKLRYSLLWGGGGAGAGLAGSWPLARFHRDPGREAWVSGRGTGRDHDGRLPGKGHSKHGEDGMCHPGGWHPKIVQWSQSVLTRTTRSQVPSHVLPEMTAPKWLLTGRWTDLCQRPSPHPVLFVS